MRPGSDKLILALDLPGGQEALKWVDRTKDCISTFKVGLQLFTKEGPSFVKTMRDRGVHVFLDLKLHDISNQVARAIESLVPLDIRFLTVHTLGGSAMLRSALEACSPATTLLGVTVLTSLDNAQLQEVGIAAPAQEQALLLAEMGKRSGLQAFVCSPEEVGLLRARLGADITLVTPGVRPTGSTSNDQKRVATPREAILAGANHLVIGRPILQSNDPMGALESILDEIEEASTMPFDSR